MSEAWRVRTAIGVGALGAAAVLAMYAAGLALRGREDVGMAIVWNGPIAFLFLSLATHLALRAVHMGIRRFVGQHLALLMIWAIGAGMLYLRLVAKTVEVSGHMTWLPLLTMQAWRHRFPWWCVALGGVASAVALYLKLTVFGGPSGVPGLVAGCILGAAVLFAVPQAPR